MEKTQAKIKKKLLENMNKLENRNKNCTHFTESMKLQQLRQQNARTMIASTRTNVTLITLADASSCIHHLRLISLARVFFCIMNSFLKMNIRGTMTPMTLILINVIQDMILHNIQEVLAVGHFA